MVAALDMPTSQGSPNRPDRSASLARAGGGGGGGGGAAAGAAASLTGVEVVDQAREHAVGIVIPLRLVVKLVAVHREGVVEVQLGGMKVLVLQAGIDVRNRA